MKTNDNRHAQHWSRLLFLRLISLYSDVFGNDTLHICDVVRYIITPLAILTQAVYRGNPFGQSFPLFFIAASFLSFCFKNQGLSVIQSNQEIWEVFSDNTIKDICVCDLYDQADGKRS